MEPRSPNQPVVVQAAVEAAIDLLGGPAEVARLRGLKTRWAVAKWVIEGLPSGQVLWLAEATAWRFTPHVLAPQLYPHPDDGLPEQLRNGRLRRFDEAMGQHVAQAPPDRQQMGG